MSIDIAILSARTRTDRVTYDYIFAFEDIVSKIFNLDIIGQSKLKFYLLRPLDVVGFNLKLLNIYPIRTKVDEKYSTIILCTAHHFEISILETINHKAKNIVLYITDVLEPSMYQLSNLIDEYNIDIVLCAYLQIAEFLKRKHKNVYWLPPGFDNRVYKDYKLDKNYTAMQVGRKHPKVHSFFLNYCKEGDYIHHFIKGNEKLAKYINRSWFFGVTPADLVYPERTGRISPVSQRYLLGMACKSMLVGFKTTSEEFELLFSDKVKMIEYTNDEEFKNELEYYLENPVEYKEIVNKNYRFVQKNHTWENRVKKFGEILRKEGLME